MLARLSEVENLEHSHNLQRVISVILRVLCSTLALDCEVASEQYCTFVISTSRTEILPQVK